MEDVSFRTPDGTVVPAVTADQMQEIDRIAVNQLGLELLQMMENAGRNLADHSQLLREEGSVTIIAGAGGNGGGGLACARHLANRDVDITVILDREPSELEGAPATQYRILETMDVPVTTDRDQIASTGLLVDALIGYGLRDAPRERAADLIEASNTTSAPLLSLDIPSGYDATTGETRGVTMHPDRTLTLALPKTGLHDLPGELYLADISIPAVVYQRLNLPYCNPFTDEYWIQLTS